MCRLKQASIILVAAALMGGATVSAVGHEASSMTIEIKINRIIEWHELGDRVRILASPSGTFWTGAERVTPEFWDNRDPDKFDKVTSEAMDVAILEDAFRDEDYVAIEFNTETRKVLSAGPVTIDYIAGLGNPDEHLDEIPVAVLKRPTMCYLRRDHKGFERLYSVLSEAHSKETAGVQAALAIWGSSIEDAIIVDEKAPKQ